MYGSIKDCLRFGAILTSICSVAQNSTAGTVEPGLKMILRVFNYAHVDPKTLSRAEHEAARIYRELGVETSWLDQSVTETQQDQSPYRVGEIDLSIVSQAWEGAGLPASALGVAPGSGPNRRLVFVFYDRVENLFRNQIVSTTKGRTSRWAAREQILGYAMTHEIGHILGLGHSYGGIMRADWGLNDLATLAYGDLTFTPQQIALIRTEVRMRQQGGLEIPGLQKM
jgi:predicted Zn-dependent protease